MAWYAIHALDADDAAQRRVRHQTEHRQRIRVLAEEGRLLCAGPMLAEDTLTAGDVAGSLLVAEFADLHQAQDWVQSDVYTREKVWASSTVKPFVKALP